MQFDKRASLEISIQAIVIVVLAMTLLGLGLGFIRKQFAGISGIQEDVTEQVRQKILDDLITGDKKISFPKSEVTIDRGSSTVLSIGVRNKNNAPLSYTMQFCAVSGPNSAGNIDTLPCDTFTTGANSWLQYNPAAVTLAPSDYSIRNIKVSIPTGQRSGSYFFTFKVLEGSQVYDQKDVFIVVRG